MIWLGAVALITHLFMNGDVHMGTKDKASNKAQAVKGKVKETVGSATGNEGLRAEGKTDQAKSSVKDVGEKVKDAAADIKAAAKGR